MFVNSSSPVFFIITEKGKEKLLVCMVNVKFPMNIRFLSIRIYNFSRNFKNNIAFDLEIWISRIKKLNDSFLSNIFYHINIFICLLLRNITKVIKMFVNSSRPVFSIITDKRKEKLYVFMANVKFPINIRSFSIGIYNFSRNFKNNNVFDLQICISRIKS